MPSQHYNSCFCSDLMQCVIFQIADGHAVTKRYSCVVHLCCKLSSVAELDVLHDISCDVTYAATQMSQDPLQGR